MVQEKNELSDGFINVMCNGLVSLLVSNVIIMLVVSSGFSWFWSPRTTIHMLGGGGGSGVVKLLFTGIEVNITT